MDDAVLGPSTLLLVCGWLAVAVLLKLAADWTGWPARVGVWIWGSLHAIGGLWLLSISEQSGIVLALLPAALMSWAMGRAVIEAP